MKQNKTELKIKKSEMKNTQGQWPLTSAYRN